MDNLYTKWRLKLYPDKSKDEFYKDLVSMMEYYKAQGAKQEHDNSRRENMGH